MTAIVLTYVLCGFWTAVTVYIVEGGDLGQNDVFVGLAVLSIILLWPLVWLVGLIALLGFAFRWWLS